MGMSTYFDISDILRLIYVGKSGLNGSKRVSNFATSLTWRCIHHIDVMCPVVRLEGAQCL
jgi:hypothetical protein